MASPCGPHAAARCVTFSYSAGVHHKARLQQNCGTHGAACDIIVAPLSAPVRPARWPAVTLCTSAWASALPAGRRSNSTRCPLDWFASTERSHGIVVHGDEKIRLAGNSMALLRSSRERKESSVRIVCTVAPSCSKRYFAASVRARLTSFSSGRPGARRAHCAGVMVTVACVQQHGHSRQRLAEYIAAHRLLFQDAPAWCRPHIPRYAPRRAGSKVQRDACAAIARIHCGALHQGGTGNGEIRREVRVVKIASPARRPPGWYRPAACRCPAKVSTSPVSVAAAAAPVNEARGVSGGSGSAL